MPFEPDKINPTIEESKSPEEKVGKTEAVDIGKGEVKTGEAIDRPKVEQEIEAEEKQEIKDEKEAEGLRQELGLEKNDKEEVIIEAEAFLKKLSIPFTDERIDKKRQGFLERVQKYLDSALPNLEKNKKSAADVEKGKKELEDKTKQLEAEKAEKEKALETLKQEAEKYIEKTGSFVILKSTKEKLAAAKGAMQYFKREGQGEFMDFHSSYDKSIKSKYWGSARKGFEEVVKINDDMGIIAIESESLAPQIKSKEGDLDKIKKDSEKIKSTIAELIKQGEERLESMKKEQEERETNRKIFSDLFPKKPEKHGEIDPLIAKKEKVTQERSEENIMRSLGRFFSRAENGSLEKCGIKNKEEAMERLRQEVSKVQESACITINIGSGRLPEILEAGRFKSTLELPVEEKRRAFGGGGTRTYDEHRENTEKDLGVFAEGTEEDPYVIVGAMASDNGHDESNGGAGFYGEVFVKLKPEVMDRCVFVDGDSIAEVSTETEDAKPGLDENGAMLAKAIRNIESADTSEKGGEFLNYVEAEILGGVKMEDVETIDVKSPKALLKEEKMLLEKAKTAANDADYLRVRASADHELYNGTVSLIAEIKKKFPKYAKLIHEV